MTDRRSASLPDGIRHGTPTAYNAYKCRCSVDRAWRRGYDQGRYRRLNPEDKQEDALKYLERRGIEINGSGPFSRNPKKLADMVRVYLGDDIT